MRVNFDSINHCDFSLFIFGIFIRATKSIEGYIMFISLGGATKI